AEAGLALLSSMNVRAPLAARVNTVAIDREGLIRTLAEEGITARPGRWSHTAVVLATRVNAFGSSAFRRVLFEFMDSGSQLVCAPCSGLGVLRRNPEARWRLSPSEVGTFPPRQIALLVTYAPLVAVGGRLVYATCSVLGDENERVIDRFLAERDDFVRVPVKEIWGKASADELGQDADGALRLAPARHDTDGFFA